jgi:hypothetical protein
MRRPPTEFFFRSLPVSDSFLISAPVSCNAAYDVPPTEMNTANVAMTFE